MAAKTQELGPHLKKAIGVFRISATRVKSLDGSGKMLVVEHRFGEDGGALTPEEAMARLGYRDEYLKEDADIAKQCKSDRDLYKERTKRAHTYYLSKARSTLDDLVDYLDAFYEPQGGLVRATWLPLFDKDGKKKVGSKFYLQAMIDRNSRKLIVGDESDYAKYLWAIKKATQRAHDKNEEITTDTREYLRMGHAGKEVTHFLNAMLRNEIGSVPLLGLNEPK